MDNNFFTKLKENSNKFTPNQKKIANYIFNNSEKSAFMTITELSKNAGVSEATITRFCPVVGYSKYNELQKALQQALRSKYSSIERFNLIDNKNNSLLKTKIGKVFKNEVKIINDLFENINIKTFQNIVNLLSEKDNIVIVGNEASTCLCHYLSCNLRKLRKNVFDFDSINDKAFNQTALFNKNTAAVIFSFPRHPRLTLEFTEYLYSKKVHLIGITDSITSPIADKCNELIFVPIPKAVFIDEYAAVMTLLNALSLEIAKANPQKTQHLLEDFEKLSTACSRFLP